MALLNAKVVYDRLTELGHDHVPDKIAYKSSVAGNTVELYDPVNVDDDGKRKRVEVRAENVEHYVEKGFLFEQGKKIGPSVADREQADHDAKVTAAKDDFLAAARALDALTAEAEEEAEEEDERAVLDKMTKAELEAEAEARGVDLSGTHNNEERRAALVAAGEVPPAGEAGNTSTGDEANG